jgi:uracil-DNA glycosylase
MGFCYPGTGTSGDLPPRPECAEAWREQLLRLLPKIELTLVIGQYAHKYHLGKSQKKTLTETVKTWKDYWKNGLLPLPHPSPRNNMWLRKNDWFEKDILPTLKSRVRKLI